MLWGKGEVTTCDQVDYLKRGKAGLVGAGGTITLKRVFGWKLKGSGEEPEAQAPAGADSSMLTALGRMANVPARQGGDGPQCSSFPKRTTLLNSSHSREGSQPRNRKSKTLFGPAPCSQSLLNTSCPTGIL